MRALLAPSLLSALLALASPSVAEAQTLLRMATPAPDGTTWARAIRKFGQSVDSDTGGAVKVKIYYGGIAGDELQVAARIRRDQLDGAFSGGMLCMKLAPTMRVMRVLGLFQNRQELRFVLGKLQPEIDDELRRAGYVRVGMAHVGPELIFSRQPIATLAALRATRLWTWDADDTLPPGMRSIGLTLVAAPLEAAAALYDAGKVDGFVAAPSAALAFQWSAQAHYLLPLHLATLDACVIISNRFMDALPVETQRIVRDVAARVVAQLDHVQETQDEALLNGLFQKQGVTVLPVSDELREQFFDQARIAREGLSAKVVPKALMGRVMSMLADYRGEHPSGGGAQ